MAQSIPRSSHPSLPTRKLAVPARDQTSVRWLEKNKPRLLKGAGVLFTLVVCALIIFIYQRRQNFIALEKLRLGIVEFQAGRLEEAVSLLSEAKKLLGSNEGAQVVNFYLIEAHERAGSRNLVEEIEETRSSGMGPDYLSQIVLLAKGRSAEKQGRHLSARKFYEDAAALEKGPLGADALLGLVRMVEATGDTDAAAAAREKFLTAYPNSPLAEIISKKLGK